jgi:hypothetical protein
MEASMKAPVLTVLAVSLLFGVFFWPLPLHWGSWIVGGNIVPTDGWMFVWNLWWVKTALLKLHVSPLFAPGLFHPQGVSLGLHSLSLANCLLSIPLQAVSGPVAAHNWLLFLSFPLSALGTYALAREVGASRAGAALAGVAFSLCPFRVAHAVGHLNLVSTQWIPAALWALLRLRRRPSIIYVLLASAFTLLAALSSWYYGIVVAVCATLLLSLAPGRPGRGFWPWMTAAAALVVFGAWPVAGRIVTEVASGQYANTFGDVRNAAALFSADPVAYVVPSVLHPVLKYLVVTLFNRLTGNWLENSVFPGYTLMALAAWWFARGRTPRRTKVMLAAVGGTGLVFSLGPCLHLAGETSLMPEVGLGGLHPTWTRCLPLPYMLVAVSPLSGLARIPARWAVVVALAVAVAAGMAVGRRKLLAWAAGALVVFEFLPFGMPMGGIEMPELYSRIRGGGAVLELPVDLHMCSYTYYQTVHGRPLSYSHVSRFPRDALDLVADLPPPLLSPATRITLKSAGLQREPAWPGFLDRGDVGWVVHHTDQTPLPAKKAANRLLSHPRLQLVDRQGTTVLYRVRR